MDYGSEEDQCCPEDETFYSAQERTCYGSVYEDDGSPERPYQDTPSIGCQMRPQEMETPKSDLELAIKLDELASAFRTGSPPKFSTDPMTPPGQNLQEFLSILEKRILEKSRKPQKRITCGEEPQPDCYDEPSFRQTPVKTPVSACKKCLTPRRLSFNETPKKEVPRGRTQAAVPGPPPSPDWRLLNDSNEINCFPSDRIAMYGLTAGDIWRRRAEERDPCHCSPRSPSPTRTPVRQVQAIPVQYLPSPKFDEEDDFRSINATDLNSPELCNCTVDEITRRKSLRAKTPFDRPVCGELPRRIPKFSLEPENQTWCTPKKGFYDKTLESLMESRSPEYSEPCRRSRSPSNSSICCCDDLAQAVADWTLSEFGSHEDKGVGTGRVNSTPFKGKKPPILKKKPIIGKKKCRDPVYGSFVGGVPAPHKSTPKSSRRLVDYFEYTPEAVALMRESERRPCCQEIHRRFSVPPPLAVSPSRRYTSKWRKKKPLKIHLVSPPPGFYEIDEISCDEY